MTPSRIDIMSPSARRTCRDARLEVGNPCAEEAADQVGRDGLIEGKANCAARGAVRLEVVSEFGTYRAIQSAVLLRSRKVGNGTPLKAVRRHAIANRLDGIRNSVPHQGANFTQAGLREWALGGDVVVDRRWGRHCGIWLAGAPRGAAAVPLVADGERAAAGSEAGAVTTGDPWGAVSFPAGGLVKMISATSLSFRTA